MSDLPERYQRQLLNENRREPSSAVVERSAGHEPLGAGKVQKEDTGRFLVRVTSFRIRLLDEDNLCEKYHVDCLRYAGLLPSDAPGKTKIEVAQVQVKSEYQERTEIELS